MKKKNMLLIAIAAAAVTAGLVAYSAARRTRANRQLRRVSDEGYETAHDVLFPDKGHKGPKLHYGPVLPS
jgi:type II secretory pathway pseudopilin PulG